MPKGYSNRNQGGWKHSKGSIELMSKNRTGKIKGEKNHRWMGDFVSYQALHNWVRKQYVKPKKCNKCNIDPGVDKKGRTKLQWSNKTKKYTRNRSDWQCLCAKCHKKYDSENKIPHKYDSENKIPHKYDKR